MFQTAHLWLVSDHNVIFHSVWDVADGELEASSVFNPSEARPSPCDHLTRLSLSMHCAYTGLKTDSQIHIKLDTAV